MAGVEKLTVAVTGPTGTFGAGLIPLLQEDVAIGRIVGVARRPFDPTGRGWTKMEYREGDVRDPAALEDAFAGADVVVHLAFNLTGNAPREELRAINVGGTLNAFRAAGEAGAERFVYASSVAAYGFHPDNPIGMTEDWPVRGAEQLFYSQEKAEIEQRLHGARAEHPQLDLYLLRPCIVVGPDAMGAKEVLPGPLASLGRGLAGVLSKLPLPLCSVPLPVPVQFVHQDDVGQAFMRCIAGDGPPGPYNLAGDGVLAGDEVVRELGLTPLPMPSAVTKAVAGAVARAPLAPPSVQWAEAMTHPSIMDTTRAKRELGWAPRYSSLEALRDTL